MVLLRDGRESQRAKREVLDAQRGADLDRVVADADESVLYI
jgi:hypothetical protein